MTTTAHGAPGRWKKEATQNGEKAFPGQGHPQDEELSRLRREVEVLRQEREILKKPSASSRSGSDNERAALSIHPRASKPVSHDYSAGRAGCVGQCILWMAKAASQRAQQKERLVAQISELFQESQGRYGSPRIHQDLQALGIRCSPKRVARLMKEQNLVARKPRRFVVTTDSDHALPIAQNLLNREFQVEAVSGLNRAWAGDITYVPTAQGWLYMAGCPLGGFWI